MSANDNSHRGLLPAGLGDLVPPEAGLEQRIMGRIGAVLAAHGYRHVKPPLVEFEESLLSGAGQAMAAQTFRLMDPVSQRMMGVRTDMTVQAARIAATRLAAEPRPLRLSYSGNVLRVKGAALRPERQFAQIGCELFGSDSPEADAEAILLAVAALRDAQVPNLSVDLNLPTLVTELSQSLGVSGEPLRLLRDALDRKDAADVDRALGAAHARHARLFHDLLRATGRADAALAALAAAPLPAPARAEADRLVAVIALVRRADPELPITVDPVEYRGLEYQTGVSFTLFSLGARLELGRGGRYVANGYAEGGEPATGFTLYLDAVLAASTLKLEERRLYVPPSLPWTELAGWQAKGFVVVRGLDAGADARAEARRLGCGHALVDGAAVAV